MSTAEFPRSERLKWMVAAALLVVAAWPRLSQLDSMVNVDAVDYWSKRIPRFWDGLASGHYKRTFQAHPGVTLMWSSGLSLKLHGLLHAGPAEVFITPAKLPGAVIGSLVPSLTFLSLLRLLGPRLWLAAALTGLLWATEPALIRQARSLHVDNLAIIFGWFASLCAMLTFEEKRLSWAVVTGVCMGLALLSRTSTAPIALGIGLLYAFSYLRSGFKHHRLTLLFAVVAGVSVITVVLGWPALMFEPAYVFEKLLGSTESLVSKGHSLFFAGELYDHDPGPLYYAAVIGLRLAPETLVAAVLGLVVCFRTEEQRRTATALGLLYVLFAVAVAAISKKTNRYVLPLFPVLLLFAAFGWAFLAERLHALVGQHGPRARSFTLTRVGLVLAGLLLVGRSARAAHIHPLPGAWCAEYPWAPCEEWMTLGGGQGFKEAAAFLEQHYRESRARHGIKQRRPSVFPPPHNRMLAPWTPIRTKRRPVHAQYLMSYLPARQRKWSTRQMKLYSWGHEPIHEVNIHGRNFVRLYLGPKHPDYPGRPKNPPVKKRKKKRKTKKRAKKRKTTSKKRRAARQ